VTSKPQIATGPIYPLERDYVGREHVAVLIDVENFFFARKGSYEEEYSGKLYRAEELGEDLGFLIQWLEEQIAAAKITMIRGYGSFTKRFKLVDPKTDTVIFRAVLARAVDELMKRGIEPILVPALSKTKNAADMRIAIDASTFVTATRGAKRVVIVAGDSDYVPVTLQVRGLGAEAIIIGLRGNTGQYVGNFADRLIYFEDLVEHSRRQLEVADAVDTPHTVELYRELLARVEPRFMLVPLDHWKKITEAIYLLMHPSSQTTSLNDVVHVVQEELDSELGEHDDSVRLVMNQLRDSSCFAGWVNGKALSGSVDEFQSNVGLAPGLDSLEAMRGRTQKSIVAALRDRLEQLNDPRPIDKHLIAQLLFGSSINADMLTEVDKLMK
jgi:uncharacterized LabA/DUF88 family protein